MCWFMGGKAKWSEGHTGEGGGAWVKNSKIEKSVPNQVILPSNTSIVFVKQPDMLDI